MRHHVAAAHPGQQIGMNTRHVSGLLDHNENLARCTNSFLFIPVSPLPLVFQSDRLIVGD